MALPKLNDKPKYQLQVPSTGKKVKYRPYLVKEEKVLMIALESQDKKQALDAVVDTILACVDGDVNRKELTLFDVEYMFIKIRSKSVGEKAKIGLRCAECEEVNELEVDLDNVEVENPDVTSSEIVLDKNITLKMVYPNFETMSFLEDFDGTETDKVFKLITSCMHSIETEEENILFEDETEKEIMEFVESLSTEQFSKIRDFVENMPRIEKRIDFNCSSCSKENKVHLRGIDDFF